MVIRTHSSRLHDVKLWYRCGGFDNSVWALRLDDQQANLLLALKALSIWTMLLQWMYFAVGVVLMPRSLLVDMMSTMPIGTAALPAMTGVWIACGLGSALCMYRLWRLDILQDRAAMLQAVVWTDIAALALTLCSIPLHFTLASAKHDESHALAWIDCMVVAGLVAGAWVFPSHPQPHAVDQASSDAIFEQMPWVAAGKLRNGHPIQLAAASVRRARLVHAAAAIASLLGAPCTLQWTVSTIFLGAVVPPTVAAWPDMFYPAPAGSAQRHRTSTEF